MHFSPTLTMPFALSLLMFHIFFFDHFLDDIVLYLFSCLMPFSLISFVYFSIFP